LKLSLCTLDLPGDLSSNGTAKGAMVTATHQRAQLPPRELVLVHQDSKTNYTKKHHLLHSKMPPPLSSEQALIQALCGQLKPPALTHLS